MAGHSHAANVAIRKGAQDKKRAQLFSKLAKEIIVAARLGGADPDSNARLRLALRKARAQSLPKDTIMRAIKRGCGDLEGDAYEEISMEGYGPGGTAILCEVMTDNRNRAAGDIRHAFAKGGGNLGTSGCVAYMFNRRGLVLARGDDGDTVMMAALECGAEDVNDLEDGTFEILTEPSDTETVSAGLANAGIEVVSDEVLFLPDTRVAVAGGDAAQLLTLLDLLDDCDDIQKVHHNADINAAAIAEYSNS
ncbi:MAG: YebC/PmpR family DNA-binding regulatory protein [Myxococcota bacterium]|jgi:YebC/PmpR family DNA-binding regulatory protein